MMLFPTAGMRIVKSYSDKPNRNQPMTQSIVYTYFHGGGVRLQNPNTINSEYFFNILRFIIDGS